MLSKLLSVGLASTIVLDLDMEILTTFRAKILLAALVWADESSVDLSGGSPQMLLSSLVWLESRAHRGPRILSFSWIH